MLQIDFSINLQRTQHFSGNLVLMEYELMSPILTAAEGFVLGLGAKLFTIAGPVIVYGTVASVLYGVIYWISTLF